VRAGSTFCIGLADDAAKMRRTLHQYEIKVCCSKNTAHPADADDEKHFQILIFDAFS